MNNDIRHFDPLATPRENLSSPTAEAGAFQPPSVSIDRIVEWIDTDASGHQHNSVVIRWVEAAEAEMMRQLELPEYFPNAPRVQQVINFTGILWFGQQTTTHLAIEKVGRTSLTFRFEVTSAPTAEGAGGPAAHGSITTVWMPAGTTKSQPWPADMKAKLEGRRE